MNRILVITIGFLLLLLLAAAVHLSILHGKVRLSKQYQALYESVFSVPETWQAKDSTQHSRVEVVTVSDPKVVAELSGLRTDIEGLKKNLKNFVSYNKVGTETTIKKTVQIRDSIFTYTTKYDTIRGVIVGDSVRLSGNFTVSLKIVRYWDRTWFLGKKKYLDEVVSENPDTKVILNRAIQTQRKQGLFRRSP